MELLSLAKHIGLTFAVGASTFAMIFYFASQEDGVVDQSERHFMHIVYFILRIGLSILVIWELGVMLYAYSAGGEWLAYTLAPINWLRIIILGIIVMNGNLMTRHAMPMWLGPALAGSSWYYYYFLSVYKNEATIGTLILGYTVTVVAIVFLFSFLKKIFIKPEINS